MNSAGGEDAGGNSAVLECMEMCLPSSIASVEEIEHAAGGLAQRAGFDEDTVSSIRLVVREAAINAGKHGNGFSPEKKIGAKLQRTGEAMMIRIADEGSGLDPASLPDVGEPENLLRDSGRGVFLMRAIMDEVYFRRLAPGTEVILIKRRSDGGDQPGHDH